MSVDAQEQACVRRVDSTAASQALAIIREAAQWASARGTPVWQAGELREELYEGAADKQELVIGYAGETPAATMLLQAEDPLYWPQDAPGTALYLHKVAIRRAYAGQSWLTRLVDFAVQEASRKGIPLLRLDTVQRPKLQSIYERQGFSVLAEEPLLVAGRRMIRMQRWLR